MVVISWLVLAAIHALPAVAFVQPSIMTRLYGLDADDQLFVLMHHRAALFVGVFAVCVWSAFDAGPRQAAVVVTAISMMTFIGLYLRAGRPDALNTIALADAVGIPFLVYAGWSAFAA